jgi:hypothetical protein
VSIRKEQWCWRWLQCCHKVVQEYMVERRWPPWLQVVRAETWSLRFSRSKSIVLLHPFMEGSQEEEKLPPGAQSSFQWKILLLMTTNA